MCGKILSFGAFKGSIETSMEDNCLYGRILGIRDVVTYEANTPQELKLQFQRAVIEYFEITNKEDLIHLLDMAIELGKDLNAQINAMTTYLETKYPTPTATPS